MTPAELATIRRALGLTQPELAALLGISRPSVARYEAGAPVPGPVLVLYGLLRDGTWRPVSPAVTP